MKKLTTEEFIKRAIKIHGNKYDYSVVEYVSVHTKVKIFCRKCQKYFWQAPNDHIRGQGCPYCAQKIRSLKRRTSIEKLLLKFNDIHKNNFNYSEVKYINNRTKIKIFCNKCKKYFFSNS